MTMIYIEDNEGEMVKATEIRIRREGRFEVYGPGVTRVFELVLEDPAEPWVDYAATWATEDGDHDKRIKARSDDEARELITTYVDAKFGEDPVNLEVRRV